MPRPGPQGRKHLPPRGSSAGTALSSLSLGSEVAESHSSSVRLRAALPFTNVANVMNSAQPSTATHFDPQNEPAEQHCWSIEPQAEVCVLAVNDGSIEIEQKSPMGKDDDQRIFVAAQNAVRLARMILFAAGFKNIVIATGMGGGFVDIEDGYEPHKVRE